jgi:formamidopyrimidine-DNA glycosylase
MPELPEVETVRRGLVPVLEGRRIERVTLHREGLRIPFPADLAPRVTGCRVARLERRAKYILIFFVDCGDVLLLHLGMSGRILVDGPGGPNRPRPPGPHDHVVIETDAGAHITFNDARRFGVMTLASSEDLDHHPLLANLGPEPLAQDFTGPALSARLAGRRTPIKAALLDQRVVAGLGNIYVCEALYRAGISPRRLARSVAGRRAERLALAIGAVLTEAIAAGGSSLRDHVRTTGEMGYFQHAFAVYGREGKACPDCDCGAPVGGGGVRRIVQGGRSTFYCARRQR